MEDLLELEKTNTLTVKQERFCQEYVNCLIGVRAYLKVYPTATYNTGRTESSKLLANPNIKARIKELQEEIKKNMQITSEFLVMKSLEVIDLALEGQEDEYCTKNGQIVMGNLKKQDKRAINDAIRNIASITGLNMQRVEAEVKANLTAKDVAKAIMEDDDDC